MNAFDLYRLRAIFTIAAIHFLVPSGALIAQKIPGTVAVNVFVDNRGSAKASIPMATPNSRGQLKPELSLNFDSSSGGEDFLASGWALSHGFPSQITRGRTILARDGTVKGVSFNNDDKLYLDGKRLICIEGQYGAPGSKYRTEIDSFSIIAANGSGLLIDGFTITSKDGTNTHLGKLGSAVDACIVPINNASGESYAWCIKRIEDAAKNYIEFHYNEHDVDSNGTIDYQEVPGEHLLTSIRYTGNGGSPTVLPSCTIWLRYQLSGQSALARGQKYYASGRYRAFANRLSSIDCFQSGQAISITTATTSHALSYASFHSAGRSLLEKVVTTTRLSGTLIHEVNLAHGAHPSGLLVPIEYDSGTTSIYKNLIGDFNGDGKTDILRAGPQGYLKICSAESIGSTVAVEQIVANPGIPWTSTGVGDFNGDGVSDIVWNRPGYGNQGGGWYISLGGPNGFTTSQVSANYNSYTLDKTRCSPIVADMDGDGTDELLIAVYSQQAMGYEIPHMYGSNIYAVRYGGHSSIFPNGTLIIIKYQPSTGAYVETSFSSPKPTSAVWEKADFNGDGKADFLVTDVDGGTDGQFGNQSWNFQTLINLGGNAFQVVNSPIEGQDASLSESDYGASVGYWYHHHIVDINSDGCDDLLYYGFRTISGNPQRVLGWHVALSKGDGSFDATSYSGIAPEVIISGASVPTASFRIGYWSIGYNDTGGDGGYLEPYYGGADGYGLYGTTLIDIDGDGRKDFVWYAHGHGWHCIYAGASGFSTIAAPLFLDQTDSMEYTQAAGYMSDGIFPYDLFSVDIDGSGHEEIVLFRRIVENGTTNRFYVARSKNLNSYLLHEVSDNLSAKNTISYGSTVNRSIYTPGTSVAYPIRNESKPKIVVSDIYKDAGNLNTTERQHFSYQYSGRRTDLSGRGDLGFHSFVTLDHQTNLFKYQFLTQSFPMTGLTAREQTYRYWESGGNVNFRLISSHDNTVVFDEVVNGANTSQAYGTVYPFISKAVESRWENSNTPHFTLTKAGSATSKPELLFPAARPSGAHITIGAQSWFDNQPLAASPPTTLPGDYKASDRTTDWSQAGLNSVTGVASYAAFDALTFPRQITYGNLRKLETDFGGGFTEKVETTYEGPTTNGITGRVDTVTTTVTSPDFGTEVAPIKRYDYWSTPGGTPTGLVSSETIDAAGSSVDLTTTYGRDGLGRVTSTSISNPSIGSYTTSTVVSFDARFDLPTVSKNAYGHETTVEYHPFFGLPTSVTDANGAQVQTTYDALGRVTQTKDLLRNLQTDYTYAWSAGSMYGADENFQSSYRLEVTSTAQPKVTTYFDRLGRSRLVEKEGFYGQTLSTSTAYNALGQITKEWSYDARETSYTYDELGRVKTIRHPDWSLTTNVYSGRVTQVQFDGQNAGWATGAGVQINTTLVDPKGRTVKVWNADNVPSSLDPITGSAQTASIQFKLDGFGRMRETVLRDQQSQPITATYDALGRQTALNDPDKGNWSYVNNVLGQVVSQTDANQNVTTSTFDWLGRPLTRTTTQPSGGPVESAAWYYYDLASNVGIYPHLVAKGTEGWIGSVQREESATSNLPGYAAGGSSTAYYYDTKGRVSTKLNNIDSKWFYTWMAYDTSSRLRDVRHYWRAPGQENPGDPATSWESYGYTNSYNARSYLTSVVDTQNRTWWQVDPEDESSYDWYLDYLAYFKKGGAWTWKWNDYATGRPMSIESAAHYFYNEYDGYGNVTYRQLQHPNGYHDESYSYDILNRLTHHNGQQTAAYHVNGNIDWKKDVNGTSSTSYVYGSSKPHAVTSAWGYSMAYDNNGNLLTRSGGGQNWTTRWAGFDKPRWLAKGSTGSEFHYNANRSRVIHLEFDQMSGSPAVPSHYKSKKIYAAGAEMEVDYKNTSPSGVSWQQDTVRIYIPAPDGIAGTREFRPFAPAGQQEKLLVYHYDTLGSIMAVTPFGDTSGAPALDDNGKPTAYAYDAWGQRRDAESYSGVPVNTAPGGDADVTPRGYTGHEMLDGLGLVHMNGRIYDPLLGRFLSADLIVDGPASLQGYNRYSYVKNNPLSFTDPSGFEAQKDKPEPGWYVSIIDWVSNYASNGNVRFDSPAVVGFGNGMQQFAEPVAAEINPGIDVAFTAKAIKENPSDPMNYVAGAGIVLPFVSSSTIRRIDTLFDAGRREAGIVSDVVKQDAKRADSLTPAPAVEARSPKPELVEVSSPSGGGAGGSGGGGPADVTVYHGTTNSAARSIMSDGFRPGSDGAVFLAEEYPTAQYFGMERIAETGANSGQVLRFTVPGGLADQIGLTNRSLLGDFRGAPPIDIPNSSGFERILQGPNISIFNEALQAGQITVKPLTIKY